MPNDETVPDEPRRERLEKKSDSKPRGSLFGSINIFLQHAQEKKATEQQLYVETLLSPVLITVSAICLAVIGFREGDKAVDTVFVSLGVSSILGAALFIDSVMDSMNIKGSERWNEFNFAYVIFSLVISSLFIALLFMYQQSLDYDDYNWFGRNLWIIHIITAILIFIKLMVKDEPKIIFSNPITVLIILFSFSSIILSSSPYIFGWFRIQEQAVALSVKVGAFLPL